MAAIEIFAFVAVFSCLLFAGAAVYINAAEHPARLECGTETAATVFGPSYRRAAAMQASLAIIATISGIAAYLNHASWYWLVGAACIFAVIPFTFLVIMPTNKILLATDPANADAETHALLIKWGRLHGVRSILSVAASCLYMLALFSV